MYFPSWVLFGLLFPEAWLTVALMGLGETRCRSMRWALGSLTTVLAGVGGWQLAVLADRLLLQKWAPADPIVAVLVGLLLWLGAWVLYMVFLHHQPRPTDNC